MQPVGPGTCFAARVVGAGVTVGLAFAFAGGRRLPMLAMLNPKIVAELDTLAMSWKAVAVDLGAGASPKQPSARDRKRKSRAKPKSRV